jgi:hypothetical protein
MSLVRLLFARSSYPCPQPQTDIRGCYKVTFFSLGKEINAQFDMAAIVMAAGCGLATSG